VTSSGAQPSAARIAVRARLRELERISPLSYRGGFHTKALAYETLVRIGEDAQLAPGLAESWEIEDEGRTIRFRLRVGAKWHDGKPVLAKDVAVYFRRWLHLPEHSWLRACERILAAEANGAHELVLRLSEPAAVLPELAAMNPCAVRAPGALDREGSFVHPVGSGPWRIVGIDDEHYVYQRVSDGLRIDLVPYSRQDVQTVVEALRHREIDAFVAGWDDASPIDVLREVDEDDDLSILSAPGSSVQYVTFALDAGPTADPTVRHAIRGAVDRAAMIVELEGGLADVCTAWSAPAVRSWPQGPQGAQGAQGAALVQEAPEAAPETGSVPAELSGLSLRILCGTSMSRARSISELLCRQLAAAGFAPELLALDGNAYRRALQREDWDLRVERTWGVPYDPYLSFIGRHLPPTEESSAANTRHYGVDPRLQDVATELVSAATEEQRHALYTRAQQLIDEHALLLPLYAPRRFALHRSELTGIELPLDPYQLVLDELGRSN
jgi:ABC-type transport system substrate-binding protein